MIGIATHAQRVPRLGPGTIEVRGPLCGQVCYRFTTFDWRRVNCVKCRRILAKARLDKIIDKVAETTIDKMRSMHH